MKTTLYAATTFATFIGLGLYFMQIDQELSEIGSNHPVQILTTAVLDGHYGLIFLPFMASLFTMTAAITIGEATECRS